MPSWGGGGGGWGTATSGGGAGSGTVAAAKTANYTATTSDNTIPCDTSGGGFTITLPASPDEGQIINVKKTSTDANTLTIDGNGNNIDGSATVTTTATTRPDFSMQFSAATDWMIL